MNVFKSLILFGFILSLFNCNEDSYDYWELNHFSFNENALKDGEEISLLYASRAPDYENKDYYVHYVVVSDETGDTVNILSNINFHLTKKDDGLNFVYHSDESRTGKSLELDFDKIQGKTLDTNFLNNLVTKKCDKVIRDYSFDHIADNNYPTVKGKIMRVMNDGESFEDFL